MQLKHSIIIAGSIFAISATALFAADEIRNIPTLRIPTTPATHDAYLSELVLGSTGAQQVLKIGTGSQEGNLIIPEKLIAGSGGNSISDGAKFAVIGGGNSNAIENDAENASIGAGIDNHVFSKNASIGAGQRNNILGGAENGVIGGGEWNKLSAAWSIIAGGGDMYPLGNEISAENSTIPGGRDNKISAENSFAAGEKISVSKVGTFAWSDYDDFEYFGDPLTPAKAQTFLVRSLNGMAINTGSSPTGVNVNINGAAQIDGQGLIDIIGSCTWSNAGTFEVDNGCYYYCDGRYRQSFNVDFNKGNADAFDCKKVDRCEFEGIYLRPGDKVTAYKAERSANCQNEEKVIECGANGSFGTDAVYKYSYCMPWDQTSTGIIDLFHPK